MAHPVQGIGPAQAITEIYDLVGKVPMQVDGTIVPVVSVGNMDQEVRWGRQAWGHIFMPAAGGVNDNVFEIALPVANADLGRLALIERVLISVTTATTVITCGPSPGLAAPTHAVTKAWADTRIRGLPSLLVNGKNNAPMIGGTWPYLQRVLMNTTVSLELNWALGLNPDTGVPQGIYFESTNRLAPIYVSVQWREGTPR